MTITTWPTMTVEAALSTAAGVYSSWDGATALPAVSTATAAGSTGTVTFASAHGLPNGAAMALRGFTPAAWNGAWTVTVVSPTVVTITVTTTNATVVGTAYAGTALWDSGLWGPDVVWNDITRYVISAQTRIGRQRETDHFATGTGQLLLDNRDGRFSPDNLSGPYVSGGVSGVRPWRPIRIRATIGGVTYPVFYGWATTWLDASPPMKNPTVTVPLVDGFAILSAHNGYERVSQGSGETTGRRIQRLLADAGWTGGANIANGTATVQATTLAQNTLTEIYQTADSEGIGAAFWIDPDGTAIFEQAYSLSENTRSSVSQATFGDGGGAEVPYENIDIGYDGDLVWNMAAFARAGGSVQTASDPTSRALYGDRQYSITNLISQTDSVPSASAQFWVARYKDPDRRINSLDLHPSADPTGTVWAQALGRRIRDLVTVKARPRTSTSFTISRSCFVDGIEHTWQPGNWRTVLRLSSAAAFQTGAFLSKWDSAVWDTNQWAY